MLPYKHYTSSEIDTAVFDMEAGSMRQGSSEAEESTLRRWQSEFTHKARGWASKLEVLVRRLKGQSFPLTIIQDKPMSRLVEVLLVLAELPSDWTTLTKAFYWEQISHPLCLG